MRALDRCDFCAEQAAGTFEIVPEELNPTETERRRAVLCADCQARLRRLIEPLLDRVDAGEDDDPDARASPTGQTDSEELIGASEDGSLLGGDSDKQAETDGQDSSPETTQQAHAPSDGDPPESYGKVLRLLRNREFPMTREEVVAIATSAYDLQARDVQQIIDESVDRGEFAETDGHLERA